MTLRRTIWMNPAIIGTDDGAQALRHEAVHVRDQARWGPLFFISYFLLPVGPSVDASQLDELPSILLLFPDVPQWLRLAGDATTDDNAPDHLLPSSSLATVVTCSGSNPNLFCSSLSGAEAPKVCIPMTRPSGPT